MQVLCHEQEPPSWWDHVLSKARGEAGLCQSAYWARLLKRLDGARPLYLEVPSSGELPSALLLAMIKVPWDRAKRKRRRGFRELVLRRNPAWIEWIDGPVLFSGDQDERSRAIQSLLDWIENCAASERISLLRSPGMARTSEWCSEGEMEALYLKNGYHVSHWATYLVDLTLPRDELWKKLSHSARKAVKKARSLGLRITKTRTFDEFCNRYYGSYIRFEEEAGREAHPLDAALLAREEDQEGYYHYYVAEDSHGEVLATLAMYLFNGTATEIVSSLSSRAARESLPAQDLLHWELICDAQGAGCRLFDLAGVNPSPGDVKERGIRRFKEKWGGAYRVYGQFEKKRSS
jgi:hypothetical protein